MFLAPGRFHDQRLNMLSDIMEIIWSNHGYQQVAHKTKHGMFVAAGRSDGTSVLSDSNTKEDITPAIGILPYGLVHEKQTEDNHPTLPLTNPSIVLTPRGSHDGKLLPSYMGGPCAIDQVNSSIGWEVLCKYGGSH